MSDREDTPPIPDDIQKKLHEAFKGYGARVVSVPFPMGESADESGDSSKTEDDGESEDRARRREEVLAFDLTPRDVKAHLDRFVIGQEEAKKTLSVAVCDHYNHVRRALRENDEKPGSADLEPGSPSGYVKQNVILLGPTGVGKTYLLRTIAQLIGVPFVKADITKFSETGYVGGDVDDLVRELVRSADGDVELAEFGIIFIDEIDKIATSGSIMGRDVSGRGVQTGLLKLLEETEVSARSPNDISAQMQQLFGGSGRSAKSMINTRHVLFVVSGAFSGLDELVEKRVGQQTFGFAAADGRADSETSHRNVLQMVTTKDFVDYGFEPEFIGRLPIRVALDELTREDLVDILEKSEGSILRQYKEDFRGYGLEVAFTDDSLDAVAVRAIEEKTGARGLMTVLDASMRDFKFTLPKSDVERFLVNRGVIDDPPQALERLLASPDVAAQQFAEFEVRQFESRFEEKYGIAFDFDDSAIDMAITVSRELGRTINDHLESTFGTHAEFLVRIKEKSGRTRFPVTPQILNRPADAVDVWL